MTYPSGILYPSTTTFPSSLDTGQTTSGLIAKLGDLYLTGTDAAGVKWGVYTPITGWDGSAASSKQSTQKTRSAGAWGGPANLTAASLVLDGYLYAPTIDGYEYAKDQLNAAVTVEQTVLTVSRGSSTRSMICARQDEVLITPYDGLPNCATFSVQLGADDPRKFATAVSASTGLPSTSGGVVVPLTVPLVNNTVSLSGRVTLSNPGNASGAVLLRVDGPVVGPQITHVGASGVVQTVALSLALNAGEYVLIDPTPDGQSVLAMGQPGGSRGAFITNPGWHAAEPGDNTWSFTAQSGSGLLTVNMTPAWL